MMQANCNLVFYGRDFKPLFSSGTQTIGTNAYFQVNNDGHVVHLRPVNGGLIKKLN